MVIKDELPKTEQGLISYINYCKAEYKRMIGKMNRLQKEQEMCESSLKTIQEGKDGNIERN